LNIVATCLAPEDICLDVEVASKSELFDVIGRHMEKVHGLAQKWVALSLSRREQVGPTGLGHGFAIPHARVAELERTVVAYVRLKSPLRFGAPDRQPVSDVLALLVPAPASEEHLKMLAEATRMFSDDALRGELRRCSSPLEIKRLFESWSSEKAAT